MEIATSKQHPYKLENVRVLKNKFMNEEKERPRNYSEADYGAGIKIVEGK